MKTLNISCSFSYSVMVNFNKQSNRLSIIYETISLSGHFKPVIFACDPDKMTLVGHISLNFVLLCVKFYKQIER